MAPPPSKAATSAASTGAAVVENISKSNPLLAAHLITVALGVGVFVWMDREHTQYRDERDKANQVFSESLVDRVERARESSEKLDNKVVSVMENVSASMNKQADSLIRMEGSVNELNRWFMMWAGHSRNDRNDRLSQPHSK